MREPAPNRVGGDVLSEQDQLYSESLRKMLVAMAEDIRVVLIKLADRLHNMQTLDALPEEKRKRIAQETLDIYSPLAHRLGIWEIKWRLDDLSFRHLNETRYRGDLQNARLQAGSAGGVRRDGVRPPPRRDASVQPRW